MSVVWRIGVRVLTRGDPGSVHGEKTEYVQFSIYDENLCFVSETGALHVTDHRTGAYSVFAAGVWQSYSMFPEEVPDDDQPDLPLKPKED